jgi:hypothetical protein
VVKGPWKGCFRPAQLLRTPSGHTRCRKTMVALTRASAQLSQALLQCCADVCQHIGSSSGSLVHTVHSSAVLPGSVAERQGRGSVEGDLCTIWFRRICLADVSSAELAFGLGCPLCEPHTWHGQDMRQWLRRSMCAECRSARGSV